MWTDSIIAAGAISAIVWVDGEAEAAGLANLEMHEPMTPQHRTRVGSIDKTYMAVVAVTVFDDLDVPAARWVPQLDKRITLRYLLSHRSGLFDYMWDGETCEQLAFGPPAPSDPEAFLQAALRYPLRDFGKVSYSSSNCAALDVILERATGDSLGLAARNAEQAAKAIPDAVVRVLPRLTHLAAFWRSDLTLPSIVEFLHQKYPP